MKAKFLMLFISMFGLQLVANPLPKTLPSVDIKKLDGTSINTSELTKDGPVVVTFWATWCVNCLKEYGAISPKYKKWSAETGMKIYAVSIDKAEKQGELPGYVKKKGWPMPVLLDQDKKLFSGLGAKFPPHTFIIGKDGSVLWEHSGYKAGQEEELHKKMIEFSKK